MTESQNSADDKPKEPITFEAPEQKPITLREAGFIWEPPNQTTKPSR